MKGANSYVFLFCFVLLYWGLNSQANTCQVSAYAPEVTPGDVSVFEIQISTICVSHFVCAKFLRRLSQGKTVRLFSVLLVFLARAY